MFEKKSKIIFDCEEKVWRAKNEEKSCGIYNANIGLGRLILELFKNTPERVTQVFVDNGAEMTCHEMRKRTIKIATHLMNCGYKQNDIVGIIATNSENLAPVVFACWTLGLPINTLAPVMLESDIIQMYSKTRPKLVFCDGDIIETIQNAIEKINLKCEVITFRQKVESFKFVDDLIFGEDVDTDKFTYPDLVNIADSIAFIVCSSGSTGSPKAICKSHRQLLLHFTNRFISKSDEQDINFSFSTIYWITGIIYLIMGSFYGSKRVITTHTFSLEKLMEIMKKFNVKSLFLPPSGFAEFVATKSFSDEEKIFKCLKFFLIGGAHISSYLRLSAKKYFPNAKLFICYGASEVDVCNEFTETDREGSVGQLYELNQAMIIDDEGKQLGPNQSGEICLLSEIPFLGYFNDPEKTRQAFHRGKFFRTGDLGYFDDDNFLFIVGRKKEMLKYNNYQVQPSEIEELINSVNGVENSCVVGVLDENTGNDVIFGFVKKVSSQTVSEKEILEFVNSKVIDAKKIRGGVHFVDSFPQTPSGKVKKNEVKKLAAEMFLLST